MDLLNSHNIIAEITPVGRGGVSAIRISGPNAKQIVSSFFNIDLKKTRYAYYVPHYVDEFIVIYYKAPNSYTGEDTCEMFCHANPALVDHIIGLLISNSASKIKMAEPGEFTKRAFLNGKMDLVQAESVLEVINSSSALMAQQKNRMLRGEFSSNIKKIKEVVLDLASSCEADIDFSEDESGIFDHDSAMKIVDGLDKDLIDLIGSCALVKDVSDSIKVVITGKPNVGKSSVFNKFVEYERAIVHHSPGTTRDYIEEDIIIDGAEVSFVDTAGVRRDPSSEIEKEGIRRVADIVATASIIMEISDDDSFTKTGPYVVRVRNKTDLLDCSQSKQKDVFYVSAVSGLGIQDLKRHVFNLIKQKRKTDSQKDKHFLINSRQISYLIELQKDIQILKKGVLDHEPVDVISLLLRRSLLSINNVLGDGPVNEDILNSVFSKFCIGK